MELVQADQLFSFNYATYDQAPGLHVAFSIYNVTSGVPIFITKVSSVDPNFGVYMGKFTPSGITTYLVIGAVYTDAGFTIVDTSRAPGAEVFQVAGASVSFLGFTYPTYDLNPNLNLQGSIYNLSSGSPVFLQNTPMVEVALGVYFGSFQGMIANSYQAIGIVYTDNTFATVDPSRAPSSDNLNAINLGGSGSSSETISYFVNDVNLLIGQVGE